MSKTTDWMPGTRAAQLNMVNEWLLITANNAQKWGIPTDALVGLGHLYDRAKDTLEAAQNDASRTPVATARCREAFDALSASMRDYKKRYFLEPPLADSDLVSLGLRPHDPTHTPSGIPTAQVELETFLIGRHELGFKIIYITGDPMETANKGYRIWYSLVGIGEPLPKSPDALHFSYFTKRRKDVIRFDFTDSGKTVYFCVQVENDGKKGPWGPMVGSLIP
ncbi:MAG: hypothetical protein LBC77_02495 [Spirochaetaceae bacterium]|jgi:hypothetical protein|nr:hypothetical protein [Spirochaetaceae bacterium]